MSNFGHGDDLGRIDRRSYRQQGLNRQQRLNITLAVTAVLLIGAGVAIGFAWGRSTAPEPEPQPVVQTETTLPAGVVEEVPTESVDPDLAPAEVVSEDATLSDEEPPPTPKQTSPKNNARINASRVYLRWTKVEDDSGDPVTYAFEIQDRLSARSYGKTQVISGLKSTSYSARVLYVTRRWRVWAVDKAGNKSEISGWRYYKHTPRPAPKPSVETT